MLVNGLKRKPCWRPFPQGIIAAVVEERDILRVMRLKISIEIPCNPREQICTRTLLLAP